MIVSVIDQFNQVKLDLEGLNTQIAQKIWDKKSADTLFQKVTDSLDKAPIPRSLQEIDARIRILLECKTTEVELQNKIRSSAKGILGIGNVLTAPSKLTVIKTVIDRLDKELDLYTIHKLTIESKLLVNQPNFSEAEQKDQELKMALSKFREKYPKDNIPGHSLKIESKTQSKIVDKAFPEKDLRGELLKISYKPEFKMSESPGENFLTVDLGDCLERGDSIVYDAFVNYVDNGALPDITNWPFKRIERLLHICDFIDPQGTLYDTLLTIDPYSTLGKEMLNHPFFGERIVGLYLPSTIKLVDLGSSGFLKVHLKSPSLLKSIDFSHLLISGDQDFEPISPDFLVSLVEKYPGLTSINMGYLGYQKFDFDALEVFKKFSKLKSLRLASQCIEYKWFNKIMELNLEMLGLSEFEFISNEGTKDEFDEIKIKSNNLKRLELEKGFLTDLGMTNIFNQTRTLEHLVISDCQFTGASCLKPIHRLEKLSSFKLSNFEATFLALKIILSQFPNLEEMELSRCKIEELEDIWDIEKEFEFINLEKLKTLKLSGFKLNDTWIKKVLDLLPNLERLVLSDYEFTQGVLEHKLEKLKTLKLSRCQIDNRVISKILCLYPNLKHLEMTNCDVTFDGMLHNTSKLNFLKVSGCKIADKEVAKIFNLFQDLEELDLSDCKFTGEGLDQCSKLEKLKSFNLSGSQVTDRGLKKFIGLLPNLESLDLSSCPIQELGELNKLSKLNSLILYSCENFNDKGLDHLIKLQNLEILDLSRCNLSEKAFEKLSKFKKLKSLTLMGCRHVTDGVLKKLAESQPLETLNLQFCLRLTKEGIEKFNKQKTLKGLYLTPIEK